MSSLFYSHEKAIPVEMLSGLTRRVLAASDEMMVVEFTFAQGVEVPEHTHPHDQVGYIVSGRMRMIIDGQTGECGAGDSYHAPPHAPHSGIAMEPSVVVDVFSPPRQDYQ